MKKVLIACVALISTHSFAQTVNPQLLANRWKAIWVTVPDEPAKQYGVYHFRKTVELPSKPSSFVVNVSADNRYKLYVNDNLVSLGPARGDMYHWNFETVDVSKYLTPGKNTFAALVWNEGDFRPEAQISNKTGFILQGNTESEEVVNTNNTWKCKRSDAYRPITESIGYPTYYVAGPGEFVNMNSYDQGWTSVNHDDSQWKNATQTNWGAQGAPKGMVDAFNWMLVPSPVPQMEMTAQRIEIVRQVEGVKTPAGFPKTKTALTVPANTNSRLILDQSFLTNAFLTMHFSRGKDASVSIRYAEALFESGSPIIKGNRNEIEGKKFLGRKDSLISNGSAGQVFTTLAWRTFRYIELKIQTKNEALTIDDIYGTFTGFPFERQATFASTQPDLQKILDIGWRTARLCAVETYMDCPYYEQLQYIGDARIQALVSFYNAGDDRLVRNALNQMDNSRLAEGVTLSRHPSFSPQIIPTFSLWYIGMLHDYWMYRPDAMFVREKLPGTRDVLNFFSKYQTTDGSLKHTPYWLFSDWVNNKTQWGYGMAPKGKDGSSSVLDLQLLWAYQIAADMETALGMKAYADMYNKKIELLSKTVREKYWDASKGVFADTPEKDIFSQHANTLAILTKLVQGDEAKKLAEKILSERYMAPASIYFRYYTHLALTKAGLGDQYLSWLDKWRENISLGLTTWAEISDVSNARSDCHAWGSSPNIEFYRIVLGIDSDEHGFKTIKIEPHLGNLTKVSGEMPHPNGKVAASYTLEKNKWKVDITIPENTNAFLLWKGKRVELTSGNNMLVL
ncbi:MAG TPA: alpha-L-rhamnosidase C-terminal domain-containing protein [Chryseosolibacter sp.]